MKKPRRNLHHPTEWVIFPGWVCVKCHRQNYPEHGYAGDPPVCESCNAKNPDFVYPRKKKCQSVLPLDLL